jgi:hypothetical protein
MTKLYPSDFYQMTLSGKLPLYSEGSRTKGSRASRKKYPRDKEGNFIGFGIIPYFRQMKEVII